MKHEADLKRVVDFFEALTEESVRQLGSVYAADVAFKDPFNEVNGLPAMTRIFAHMFKQVDAPRFVVTNRIVRGEVAFMTWDFVFKMRRFSQDEQCVRGATHLRFNADGLVVLHRDYWDAAEELYEKLPVLGGLMRMLKRLANA
jgi:ketosteroid isomerase-like protein